MGVSESVKDFYFKLEDKYYNFLDWLDGKGLPVYKVVDAVEAKNIPSFPIAIICLVAIVLLLFFAVAQVFPSTSNFSIMVFDDSGKPIQGALVKLNLGTDAKSQLTGADGKANFSFPLGAKLAGSVTKDGYAEQKLDFVAEKTEFVQNVTLVLEITVLSRTIQLMDKSSGSLLKKEVSILFSCAENASYSKEKTTSTGTILLDDIPNDCGTLIATPTSAFTIEQGNIDLSQSAPQLNLSEQIVEKGTVKVFLKDAQGNAVAGVTIKLMRSDGVQQQSKPSSTAGSVQFDDAPVGNYYIRTYDGYNNKFADFDSSIEASGIKQLGKDATIEFNISLVEKVIGRVKVLVKDKATGNPVQNASVSLLRNNSTLNTQSTNIEGKAEFAASETAGYSIKVDHQSYLIEFRQNISPGDSFIEVKLTLANSSNLQALIVSVLDQKGLPVENAKLTLKKLDGAVVSDTLATGIDGNASFERIAPDTYYVYAVKDGFDGINSEPITIAERQANYLQVTLNIGNGTIELTALDEEMKPIQGATVKMFNYFNAKEIERSTTGSDGKKSFNVRADKTVYFVISSQNFANYTTAPIVPEVGNTVLVEAKLAKDVPNLELELLGLFVDKDSASDSLAPGQKYKAKLQLRVPSNSTFTEAGVHLRTGKSADGKTNTMEADPIYISKISAAASSIIKGTIFTPASGYATDSKQLTSGNAKWANLVFNKPAGGVYEIEAEIVVRENAQIGSILEFNYRAWGKSATYLRYPQDKVLGESETAGGKQALYANALKQVYSVGPNGLCGESFCYYFSIEDLDADLVTSIIDSYDAKISGNYKLLFTIISKEDTVFQATSLEFNNDSAGLKLGDYSILDAGGRKATGTAKGKLTLDVGDIRKNSSVQGELKFRTEKEGLNKLKLSMKSQKESVFAKSIDVSVSAAAEMKLDMLPKIVVPFVDNDIILQVTDSNSGAALSDAVINVSLDDTVIFSGETDSAGIAHFTVQAPNAGSLLRMEVTKNGYRTITKEQRVTQNILTVTPEEINELLTTNGIFSLERDLHLSNETTMKLQITDLKTSADFNELVSFSWKENYIGTSVDKNVDKNIFLKMELTDKGKRVEEIKKLEGALSIFVTSSELKRTWAMNVPMKIRIGFGQEVSDESCFTIDPADWQAFTGKKQLEQTFTLKNNCKVDKTSVALRTVQIKIDYGKDQPLGSFVATSSMSESNTVKLTNTLALLAPMIGAGEEASITISFTPDSNVSGGESKPKIIIKAINPTENGPEELTAKISVDLGINDLAQCIELKKTKNLLINSCPYGTGYGQYQNYGYGGYGNMGAQQNRFASPYQYGDTSFAGYPEQLEQQHYPYSTFSEPFYDSQNYGQYPGQYGSQGYNTGMRCGTTSFVIVNNCASRVQIDLEADPALQIAEQTFDLDPSEEKETIIEASYFIGIYPVDVKAKVKESKEKSVDIANLLVTVQQIDDPSQYRDCIKLNTTKFKFNDFIQKPVTGKVFNTCYAQGVRLDFDSVRFSQSAYGERYAATEGTTEGRGSGRGLIENIEVIDLTTKPQGNNKITQVLEFEIYKNVEYRRQEGFPKSGTPFAQIGQLRAFASGAYNRIEAPAILIVNYTSPVGGPQSKKFHVTIEDWWNALGTLEGLNSYGCPNIPAQSCIMETALEFGKDCFNEKFGNNNYYEETRDAMRVGDCRPQTAYNQDVYSKAQQTMTQNPGMQYAQALEIAKGSGTVQGAQGNVCGTADKVYLDEGFSKIEQDGVVITLEVVASKNPSFLGTLGGKHSIKVGIDRSKATKSGPIEINKRLSATVYRQTPLGPQKVEIPFHVCVQGYGKDTMSEKARICAERLKQLFSGQVNVTKEQVEAKMKDLPECQNLKEDEKKAVIDAVQKATQPVTLKCTEGESGAAALAKYGFEKLPFTWRFAGNNGIKKNTCDSTSGEGKYCDAVQNIISIAQKAKNAKEKMKEWTHALNDNTDKVSIALGLGANSDDLKKTKDAKNLFRWALKQQKIGNEVFFVDDSGKILNNPVVPDESWKTMIASIQKGELAQSKTLLAQIAGKAYAKDIVAELSLGGEKQLAKTDADMLKAIGAKEITKDVYWVMLFEDYKKFHDALNTACGADWAKCKTAKANISLGSKAIEISAEFLTRFLNSVAFKRGIRDSKEMTIDSPETKTVIEQAAMVADTINRDDFQKLWNSDINTTVYLAADGYTEGLQRDFKAYYSQADKANVEFKEIIETIGNTAKWRFLQNTTEAGLHAVLVNYNFENETFEIEFKKIAEPEEKLKGNWFIYNPIDGQVGSNREGYGIGFTGSGEQVLFKKDGDNDTDKVDGRFTGGLKQFNASIDSSFETASTGKILDASGSSFTYSPSTAFRLEMSLKGLGNKVALYDIAQVPSAKALISWDNAKETFGLTPASCGSSGTNPYYGVETSASSIKAPFFVPASSNFELVLWCARDNATLTATEQDIGQRPLKQQAAISADSVLKSQSVRLPLERTNSVYEFKQYLDAVNKGLVCISSASDSLKLSWKPETVAGITVSIVPSSQPSGMQPTPGNNPPSANPPVVPGK